MDIIKAIGENHRYTLHSHTEFCDGRAQMEAFARKAVEMQFDLYGFSPHSPVPIQSPCNMLAGNVDRYLNEVKRIQQQYGQHVTFLASMEIDYLGDEWGPAHHYFQEMPLDYRIGSVHFIPTRDGEMIDVDGNAERFKERLRSKFNNDLRYVVEKFYEQSIKMVNQGGFDIIGHFDKIGENSSHISPETEFQPWYTSLVNELIDNIISHKIIVEINTKINSDKKRLYPNERYWDKLIKHNVPIIVNSDAHVPALINTSRDETLALLKQHIQQQPHLPHPATP